VKVYTFGFPVCTEWGECIKSLDTSEEYNLAVFFAPFEILTEEFDKQLREKFGYIDYIAVSTRGAVYNADTFLNGISGFFIKFEREGSHEIYYRENISENLDETSAFFQKVSNELKDATSIVFSTASNITVDQVLNRLSIKKEKIFSFSGGVASSFDPDFRTKIICNGKTIEDGMVFILLRNVFSVSTISLGFLPVGPGYRITKSYLNKVYEFDGIHVKHFLDKLLQGTGLYPENLDLETTSKYLWNFPFQIVDKNTGFAYICRTPKMYNPEEEAFEFWGIFNKNDVVKISIGDPDDLIDDIDINMKLLKINLYEKDIKPEVALNFSCVARSELFQRVNDINIETRVYKRYFPDTDIVGMLTYGEIGMDKLERKAVFYNQTSIMTVLWEE